MVANGADGAARRRRRPAGGSAAAGAGYSSKMLQFYTEESVGLKLSPGAVLVMSVLFVAAVALLHAFGKFYRSSHG